MSVDKRLDELPESTTPAPEAYTYILENNQSYRTNLSTLGQTIIDEHGVVVSPINEEFVIENNVNTIIQGINNNATVLIDASRIDVSNLTVSVDGGTFYDAYVNTTKVDGGEI